MKKHQVTWIDSGREPTQPANPKFPKGMTVDFSKGGPSCYLKLPYPAKRCGAYLIQCNECKVSILVTTAGRADDPRSIRLPCIVEIH